MLFTLASKKHLNVNKTFLSIDRYLFNVLEIQKGHYKQKWALTILMIIIIWLIFLQIWSIYNDVAEKLLSDDMLQYVTIRFIFQ